MRFRVSALTCGRVGGQRRREKKTGLRLARAVLGAGARQRQVAVMRMAGSYWSCRGMSPKSPTCCGRQRQPPRPGAAAAQEEGEEVLAGSSRCTAAAAAAAAVVVLVFAAAQQPAQSRRRGVLMPGGVNTYHVLLFVKSFVNAPGCMRGRGAA